MPENDAATATANPGKGGRFNWLIWPAAILGIAAAGYYGYQRFQFDADHVVTDNAQVQGKIVKILAPEKGFLQTVKVTENEAVTQGQVLAELENRYYKLEVERAQARLNSLQAQRGTNASSNPSQNSSSGGARGLSAIKLDTAQANLEVIQAQLQEAQSSAAVAQTRLNNVRQSFGNGEASQVDVNAAQAAADQANARLLTLQKEELAAKQQVQESAANSQLLDYNIQEARAELAQAKLGLEFTQIKSPIDGYATQINVNPGIMMEQGQYMLTVISAADKWLVANIKETDFERVFVGDPVDIAIDAFPGTNFKGMVDSLSPAAGNQFSIIPRNNASGNFIKIEALIPVVIRFTEPLEEIEKLVAGMSAEVQITVDAKRGPRSTKAPTHSASVKESEPSASKSGDQEAGASASNPGSSHGQ